MGKHFVRTVSAAVLVVGSLIVVAAQPASAFKYFVHGNVHCNVTSGVAGYSPPLRFDVSQTVKMKIKGSLACDEGETGIPGTTVTGGSFQVQSDPFGGDCSNITSDQIEMTIRWTSSGVKVRNTEVSWLLPVDASTEPFSYHYAGGKVENFGISGSYLGATGAVSFIGNLMGSLACPGPGSKLRGGWALDPSSELSFQSAPYINAVNPNSATLGTQNLDVDVTGQDFTPGDTVSFSGDGITVNSTTVNSDTDLTANISVDPGALAGTRDVTVTNNSLGSNTCVGCFMVAPIVSGVAPATAGQGAQNRNVTITGQGFANGAVAQIGTPGGGITTNYTQFVDANTVIANISVANGAPLTTYDVTVTDPGFGVGTCSACFSVNSGPTVSSTSPSSRGAGAVNQVIAVNGTGFAPDTALAFGGAGITISNTTYVSSTQMRVTISIAPGSTNGPRSVTAVNSDGGQGSCAACFTVNKGPNPTDWTVVTPQPLHTKVLRVDSKGRVNRTVWQIDVQLTGSNFQPGSTVTYASDDVTVNTTTYVSTTKIKQNVYIDVEDYYANALPGDRAVTVTNPDGGSFTLQGAVVLLV